MVKIIKLLVFLAALAAAVVFGAKYLPKPARDIVHKATKTVGEAGEKVEKAGDRLMDKDRKKLQSIIDGLQERSK